MTISGYHQLDPPILPGHPPQLAALPSVRGGSAPGSGSLRAIGPKRCQGSRLATGSLGLVQNGHEHIYWIMSRNVVETNCWGPIDWSNGPNWKIINEKNLVESLNLGSTWINYHQIISNPRVDQKWTSSLVTCQPPGAWAAQIFQWNAHLDEAQGAQIGPCTTAADEFKAPRAKLLVVTDGDRGSRGDPGGCFWMGNASNSWWNMVKTMVKTMVIIKHWIKTYRNTVNKQNQVTNNDKNETCSHINSSIGHTSNM